MKEIELTKGKIAIVDDEDFEWLSQWSWCYAEKNTGSPIGYAKRGFKLNGRSKLLKMHREIMKAPPELQVDHIDGNTLNNQKSNLRICTRNQNNINRISKSGVSGYKGVYWFKPDQKWRAKIKLNKKEMLLGYFKCAKEAAMKYDEAAIKLFGEFAKTNKAMGLL